MEIYFAGASRISCNEYLFEKGYNKLYSYVNDKSNINRWIENLKKSENLEKNKLFIDSGAYTAWTRGITIDVDDYIQYINERSNYIYLYGQVDSIPGDKVHGATMEEVVESAKKTWDNYLYMRSRMNNPEGLLYTYHIGEPIEFLKQALEWVGENKEKINYMALGGLVGKPARVRQKFLDSCFECIKNSSNDKIKIHLFGVTSMDILSTYSIESADSTSWIMTGANGGIMTDNGIITVSDRDKNNPNHYTHLSENYIENIEKNIIKLGFSLKQLMESADARIPYNASFMKEKTDSLNLGSNIKRKKLF